MSRDLVKNLIDRYELPLKVIGSIDSGEKAINLIKEMRPDIVFLDIQMPVLNGIEVMERIGKTYNGIVKFIVITAYNYFEYAQSSLRLGAKDILLKPIDSKQFLDMMCRVMGYTYTNNQIFNNILEYLNSNYQNNISLGECAGQFHISPNHIARMFKKYMNISYISYLNEIRVKKAMELLKDTDMPIKEIAEKVGYNNLNYFYKNFSLVTGITPKVYKYNGN